MNPFESFTAEYQGKKVLLFGLGTLGRGIGDAQIFAEIGATVRVTDKKDQNQLSEALEKLSALDISYTLGEHTKADIEWADVIIRNASVPWNAPLLEYARSLGIPIKMDACLFFEYANPSNVVAVTGTRGKSTTTTLTYEILTNAGKSAILAGNISPVASLSLLKDFDEHTYYVFELSSWQLQAFHQEKISPHISVFTNIYEDHLLDRSFEEYLDDKTAIFRYQTKQDHLVISRQVVSYLPQEKFHSNVEIVETVSKNAYKKTNLVGAHNQENIALASAVARICGVDDGHISNTVETFTGVPFRLENRGRVRGALVINDTTSTTPIALEKAITAYPNAIVIVGGTSKHLDTQIVIESLNRLAKKIILLEGSGTNEIRDKLDPSKCVGPFTSLEQVFASALHFIESDSDVILFSPGFTSFGMFENEFDRGNQFNNLVKKYQ